MTLHRDLVFRRQPHTLMNRIRLLSSFIFAGALPLSATVVIADFNDMTLGDLRSSNVNQTADSGVGFSDAYWAVNTGVPRIVAGDLSASLDTNYGVSQTGNARSFQSTNYTIADATDRRQARTLSTPLTNVVWFSFLVNNAASDSAAGIDFNIATSTFGTTVASRIVIEGTTLRVINAGSVESASISNAITLGQTSLVVGRIEIGASGVTVGNDVINLWIDPVLTENSAGMGASTWGSNNTNFLGSGTSISILGLQSYSTLTGSGQNGGVLDSVRLADGDYGYFDVTGLTSIPEPSTLGLVFGMSALAGAAIWRRRSSR